MQERCSSLNLEGNPCGGYVLSEGKCYAHGGRRSGDKRPALDDELALRVVNGEASAVAAVLDAASEDWRAAAWFLERAHPERWGKVSTKLRPPASVPPEENPLAPPLTASVDPFTEVDELAERRRTSST